MQIHQIINSIFQSNTYILTNDKYCWIVDIGDTDKVCDYLDDKYNVKSIFITHSHFDHIYGLNDLIERFPDCTIYISESGKDGLFDDKRNFSLYHEQPINFKGGEIRVVKDRDIIKLSENIEMECIATPGHDTSCMTYRCGNYLFTGDSYIPNEKPVTKLKGGNKEDYQNSLQKILGIIDSDTIVCPGHGKLLPSILKISIRPVN